MKFTEYCYKAGKDANNVAPSSYTKVLKNWRGPTLYIIPRTSATVRELRPQITIPCSSDVHGTRERHEDVVCSALSAQPGVLRPHLVTLSTSQGIGICSCRARVRDRHREARLH